MHSIGNSLPFPQRSIVGKAVSCSLFQCEWYLFSIQLRLLFSFSSPPNELFITSGVKNGLVTNWYGVKGEGSWNGTGESIEGEWVGETWMRVLVRSLNVGPFRECACYHGYCWSNNWQTTDRRWPFTEPLLDKQRADAGPSLDLHWSYTLSTLSLLSQRAGMTLLHDCFFLQEWIKNVLYEKKCIFANVIYWLIHWVTASGWGWMAAVG